MIALITPRSVQAAWCKMTPAPQEVHLVEALTGYGLIIGPRYLRFSRRVCVGSFTSAIPLAEFSDCVKLAVDDFVKGRVT